MDYRDVTDIDFKSKRVTNPLMPQYIVRDDKNSKSEIGFVQGSTPCVLPPQRTDKNFLASSLTTSDILGCTSGTKGLGNFHNRQRKDWRSINNTKDIPGAQPNTLKKGPVTKRVTHPLVPEYQIPGRLELSNKNDVFGPRNH